ncbi:hypothetical protein [Holospora curviuscula]|uniref:Uncharacterized protein n=1 Tax=Holospora curviuscula TaxID=1082868 RepID=A0A2S5R9E0_9PROT|nr:hypothetical protein [Holospora curviuscula]PPE03941.1 hypothetical protein HCUR_00722 [Holospora curviuscula]
MRDRENSSLMKLGRSADSSDSILDAQSVHTTDNTEEWGIDGKKVVTVIV